MKFFNRKPKVRLDVFCRDFYDNQILHRVIGGLSVIDGMSVGEIYFDAVRGYVTEADSSFASVDLQMFAAEMVALRFEVFGLAWLHEVGDRHAAAQTEFTQRYLEEHGKLDIWESIEPYNQAVARSSTLGQKPDTPSGRAYLVFVDGMRIQMFEKWSEQGFDLKCVARTANRLSTEEAWKKNLTPGFLMLTLCDRLSCEVNEEAQFRLITTIIGLYNGTKEVLGEVKIEA